MGRNKVTFEFEEDAYEQIYQALKRFGSYEIGGMLIGYKKGQNHFSISDVTVADDIGNFNIASFIREPLKSMKVLLRIFKRKNYNYIGEWHSHPKFRLFPSQADVETMEGILDDPGYGVNFALLVITKLQNGKVDMAGFLFHNEFSGFVEASIK